MKIFCLLLLAVFLCSCQPLPSAQSPPEVSGTTPSVSASASTPEPSPSDQSFQPIPSPSVRGQDQDGKEVDLSALSSKGPVLVFFYPKAGTPGCTAQACSLRDAYEDLKAKGLTIVGVSMDSSESQKSFQTENKLPYTLIADREGVWLKAFGVTEKVGMANREAFLIKDNQIVWHDASASTADQAKDVLEQIAAW